MKSKIIIDIFLLLSWIVLIIINLSGYGNAKVTLVGLFFSYATNKIYEILKERKDG